jgi:hypothetical protein
VRLSNGIRHRLYYRIILTYVNEQSMNKNRGCFQCCSDCSSDSIVCIRSHSSKPTSIRGFQLRRLRRLRQRLLIKTQMSRVTNTPFFYYTIRNGDLYPGMIMMLRAIDLKSEHLNPILDLQNEQHSSTTLQALCF